MNEQIDFNSLTALHTPDWLRSFEGCEHYTDDEATTTLHALDILAHVLLQAGEHACNIKRTIVIPLTVTPNKKAA